jgi:hypothetical protein
VAEGIEGIFARSLCGRSYVFFVDVGSDIDGQVERGQYIQNLGVCCRGKTLELGEGKHLFADVNQRRGRVI